MIRKLSNIRPALITGFVLLWACHFSFGTFYNYYPDYAHAHDGEVQAHSHGGHFHSLELELLARFIEPGAQPLLPGETHHHSESLPDSDSETIQYDINKSSLPKIQLRLNFNFDAAPVFFVPAATQNIYSPLTSSGANRILLLPQSFIERSPPLRV